MARLQLTTPDGTQQDIELTAESMTIGRTDDNMIMISDSSVSSHHGELSFDGAQWTLRDLGSTNGTKINGQRVEQIVLTNGTTFSLGSVDCTFFGDATAEETSAMYDTGRVAASMNEGYGALPYDASLRSGFGPHPKAPSPISPPLLALGIISIAACLVIAFLVSAAG